MDRGARRQVVDRVHRRIGELGARLTVFTDGYGARRQVVCRVQKWIGELSARCMYSVDRWIDARYTALSIDYLKGAARRQAVDRVQR